MAFALGIMCNFCHDDVLMRAIHYNMAILENEERGARLVYATRPSSSANPKFAGKRPLHRIKHTRGNARCC